MNAVCRVTVRALAPVGLVLALAAGASPAAPEEMHYDVHGLAADGPDPRSRGDVRLRLRWAGPGGDAVRTLRCDGGRLSSAWPDPDVCARLLAARPLRRPITIETRDIRQTDDPRLFSAVGRIDADPVKFRWTGSGSGTRLGRLREWERALGPAAIEEVRRHGGC